MVIMWPPSLGLASTSLTKENEVTEGKCLEVFLIPFNDQNQISRHLDRQSNELLE